MEDDLVSQYDDPLEQLWARGEHGFKLKQAQSPAARAFEDYEESKRRRVDEYAKNLDHATYGNAFVAETFGGFAMRQITLAQPSMSFTVIWYHSVLKFVRIVDRM